MALEAKTKVFKPRENIINEAEKIIDEWLENLETRPDNTFTEQFLYSTDFYKAMELLYTEEIPILEQKYRDVGWHPSITFDVDQDGDGYLELTFIINESVYGNCKH